MTMFINQMLGCLIIAAGIGGAVGWLLRHVSTGKLSQQLTNVTAMMHLKEQMLEKARHELRASAANMQALESRLMASQALSPSNQEERSLRQGCRTTLQEELAAVKFQLSAWESGQTRLLKLISDSEDEPLAQTEETRRSITALEAAYTQSVAQQIDKAA
jgi:hypothetical protein